MFYDNYNHNYADYIINLLYRISQVKEIYFVILKEYRVKIQLCCSTKIMMIHMIYVYFRGIYIKMVPQGSIV